ncbi:MAG: creatininase family protein, partial [Acidobacteria bacterium]|nr:creatininase family protein [Acidobacteriota bacterium]
MRSLFDLTWTEVEALDRGRTVALLPVGAVEAHGPHLPLGTDGVIARAMAEEGGRRLQEAGVETVILPSLHYTAAPFAASFPGTLSVRPKTVKALIGDLAAALLASGFRGLAIVNAHLDPTHLQCLEEAAAAAAQDGLVVAFPNLARRRWARLLTEEFKSGAC